MTTPRWNDPDEDANNPRRPAERASVREEMAARLAERAVALGDDASDQQVVELLDAVEDFERARAAIGGDSMVNDAYSSSPDDPALVLPARRSDESIDAYIRRIRAATERLA